MSDGKAWLQGEDVCVANVGGARTLKVPEYLHTQFAEPPPSELMETTYDYLHAADFDLGPYAKLDRGWRMSEGGKGRAGWGLKYEQSFCQTNLGARSLPASPGWFLSEEDA